MRKHLWKPNEWNTSANDQSAQFDSACGINAKPWYEITGDRAIQCRDCLGRTTRYYSRGVWSATTSNYGYKALWLREDGSNVSEWGFRWELPEPFSEKLRMYARMQLRQGGEQIATYE